MKQFYNCDCMEKLKDYPDKYFSLAIVDPPYGINYDLTAKRHGGEMGTAARRRVYNTDGWDSAPPSDEYFNELFRISKAAIIWGGNYFKQLAPFKSFICWDKRINDNMRNDWADCELAYITPGLGPSRVFRYLWNGMLQGNMKNKEERFHPTQKLVALYRWLLMNYATPGDLILDTHVGSASSLIACEELGFDYVGFEINTEYYNLAVERINDFNAQLRFDWRLP